MAARMRRAEVLGLRGEDSEAAFAQLEQHVAESTETQAIASVDEAHAGVALARGDTRRALELARRSYERMIGPDSFSLQVAARAAAWLGDAGAVSDVLKILDGEPGRVPAVVRREGQAALAALDGRRSEALVGFHDAIRRWRELGLEFEAAVCALNLVTLLGPSEPEVQTAADDAAALFERVGAKPMQKLLDAALRAPRTPVAQPATERARAPTARARSE